MPRMRKDGLAVQLENLVSEHPDFETRHEPTLNSYCFRCVPNSLVESKEEPEVQALLDILNEEIVKAVRHNGFTQVVTIRVQQRSAIQALVATLDEHETWEIMAPTGRIPGCSQS